VMIDCCESHIAWIWKLGWYLFCSAWEYISTAPVSDLEATMAVTSDTKVPYKFVCSPFHECSVIRRSCHWFGFSVNWSDFSSESEIASEHGNKASGPCYAVCN